MTESMTTTDINPSEMRSIRRLVRRDVINEQIDALVETVSSDNFLGLINEIAALPTAAERRQRTEEVASLGTLKERGIPTPDALRFTTRDFESPDDGRRATSALMKLNPELDPRMGFCVSVGTPVIPVCVSYGN